MILQSTLPINDYRRNSHQCKSDMFTENTDAKPRVRITETDEAMKMIVELPGVNKDKMHLTVNDENIMTISADRTMESDSNEKLLMDEIKTNSYKRLFIIPNKYETDKIEANFKNGMLLISIPKKETLKPKTINIQ